VLVAVVAIPPMVEAELALGWIPLCAILLALLALFGTMRLTVDFGAAAE